jgi:hypothetical protein
MGVPPAGTTCDLASTGRPVERAEGGVALRLAPEQQVLVGRQRGQQPARLLVQAEPAGGAGRPSPQELYARTGRGAPPSSVASGTPAATAIASHKAMSNADSAMRTMPVTPISAKRRCSLAANAAGAMRSPRTTSAASSSTARSALAPLRR